MLHMFKDQKRQKQGYTLTEMLTVIAIIAVVCAIAIPSIFFLKKTLEFKRCNDYAKSIFMAAQANLTEMRSDGNLTPLQPTLSDGIYSFPEGSEGIAGGENGFPTEEWTKEYCYTTSDDLAIYSIVLPAGSIDEAVRSQQVIIEYNPITGNVFSVFYCEDDDQDIITRYKGDKDLPRDKAERKKLKIGYYEGSGLPSSELDIEETAAQLLFENGQEGILTVAVPLPSIYYSKPDVFWTGLDINLEIEGENGGTLNLQIKDAGTPKGCRLDVDGKTVLFDFSLDSLINHGSFANLSSGKTDKSISVLTAADFVETAEGSGTEEVQALAETDETEPLTKIKPGDNISVMATVTYENQPGDPMVEIDPGMITDINPMFSGLVPSTEKEGMYILLITNGRNLQNLNAIHPDIAAKVNFVSITEDIYWNETVDYYNEKHGTGGNPYANSTTEAPARQLPYFVPIHSEALFGTAQFVYPSSNNSDLLNALLEALNRLFGTGFFTGLFEQVPTLTDELDTTLHPTISGKKADGTAARIYHLDVDVNQYPTYKLRSQYYAGVTNTRPETDRFAGLFGYINTIIDRVHVVNPIIKGYDLKGNNNPATGALVGCAGYRTVVTNCAAYIDTVTAGNPLNDYDPKAMTQAAFDAAKPQTWYGVSGGGAVGGLVGYAKSHRTVKGDLTNDANYLSFSTSFAAVNVSGTMRGDNMLKNPGTSKHYGYSNGVGGFIGNSQLTNFYNCYASGHVMAKNCYVDAIPNGMQETLKELWEALESLLTGQGFPELLYNGRTSMGAGGFVGSSHGTRYTNCFATGNVTAENARRGNSLLETLFGSADYSKLGAGGFVGAMCIDETFAYGHDSVNNTEIKIAQRTVFTDCYSVGLTEMGGTPAENFSGANCRVRVDPAERESYRYGDYYELYAPHYCNNNEQPPDYEDLYIYRHAYYLSNYYDNAQQNSDHCASAELYDTFTDLPGVHEDEGWINDQITRIKDIRISNSWFRTYNSEYFRPKRPTLENLYKQAYAKGYPDLHWHSANSRNTHPYNQASGTRYPFSKLTWLDYYGDWPSEPSDVGLGYYEQYSDNSFGYYFDRDSTATITKDPADVVISDGFAVLSASNSPVTVKVNGETFKDLAASGTYTPAKSGSSGTGNTAPYHVFRLSKSILDAAEAELGTGESAVDKFYVKMQITQTINKKKATYTVYFNPNIPQSQVNPYSQGDDEKNKIAEKPEAIPRQLYIRTARQLAGLSTMDFAWTEEFHYYQQLNINADTYTGASYTTAEAEEIKTLINAQEPMSSFAGTYTGSAAYVEQPSISGFGQLFGKLESTAYVSDLMIQVPENATTDTTVNTTVSIGNTAESSVGMLAGENCGIVTNVDLTVAEDFTLTAKNNAGLLIGSSSGDVTECDVTVGSDSIAPTVTLTAANNAGGLIGAAIAPASEEGSESTGEADNTLLSDNTVTLYGSLTASATNFGGIAGTMENITSENLSFTGNGRLSLTAEHAAGIAAGMKNTSLTTVNMTLGGTDTCTGVDSFGGLAASAENARITAATASISKNISAGNAAGLVVNGKQLTLRNSSVTIGAELAATNAVSEEAVTGAAGAAVSLDADSILQDVTVNLGTISSAGNAAGFAVDTGAAISNCTVKLGNINGSKDAAGFALNVTGEITGGAVAGAGEITATGNAAGFAVTLSGKEAHIGSSRVLPDYNEDTTYGSLKISGTNAAGFVLNNAASVTTSTAVGTVSGTSAAGFVGTNSGSVEKSYCNVQFGGETANTVFAGTNSGTVLNCYGLGGGKTVKLDESGKYTSSYFINMNGGSRGQVVRLFDSSSVSSMVALSALDEGILNSGGTIAWFDGGTYESYPFDDNLNPPEYPYPMLRDHYGDWLTRPTTSFGVAYYEKVTTEGVAKYYVELHDMSNPGDTIVGGKYTLDTIDQVKDKIIDEAGYAYFYCNSADGYKPFNVPSETVLIPFDGNNIALFDDNIGLNETVSGALTDITGSLAGYVLAPIDTAEVVLGMEVTAKGISLTFHPGFARAFGSVTDYEVRTPYQLSNIGAVGKAFQSHHIVLPSDYSPANTNDCAFTGTGYKITTPGIGVFRTVGKSLTDVEIIASASVLKDLITEISAGAAAYVTFDVKAIESGSLVGTLAGSLTCENGISVDSIAAKAHVIGKVNGTLSGTQKTPYQITVTGAMNDSAIGTLSGKLSYVTLSAGKSDSFGGSGLLVNTMTGIVDNCTVTGGSFTLSSAGTFGGLVGENSGTITCSSVAATINVPGGTGFTVGGLVGENSGTIGSKGTTCTVTGAINYAASTEGTEATNYAASAEGTEATNQIGGAIGHQVKGSVTGVASTVVVSPALAGEPVNSPVPYVGESGPEAFAAVSPAMAGPVGKFVGYLEAGTMENCSAVDGAVDGAEEGSVNLQFLGEVKAGSAALEVAAYGYPTGTVDKHSFTTVQLPKDDTSVTLENWNPFETNIPWFNAKTPYRIFNSVTLTNCTFDYPGATKMQVQTTELGNKYFYNDAPKTCYTNYTIGAAPTITMSSEKSILIRDLNVFKELTDYDKEAFTGYYAKNPANSNDPQYYQAYIKKTSGNWEIKLVVFIKPTDETTITLGTSKYGWGGWDNETCTLYEATIPALVSGNEYIFVNSEKALTWDATKSTTGTTGFSADAFSSKSDLYSGIWNYNGSTIQNISSGHVLSGTVETGSIANATIGAPATYKINDTEYVAYPVTEATHWFELVLTNSGRYNHICGFVDSGSTVAVNDPDEPENSASTETTASTDPVETTAASDPVETTAAAEASLMMQTEATEQTQVTEASPETQETESLPGDTGGETQSTDNDAE